MKKHLSMSIEWLEEDLKSFDIEENWEEKKEDYCEDNFNMSYWEVIQNIRELKAKWYRYISSSDCDNIAPDWSCAGHL